MGKQDYLIWRANTPQLLKEVLTNNETSILAKPLTILARLLSLVGEVAAKINEPAMNGLMCRLAIYEIADPYNANANIELANEIITKGEIAREKLTKGDIKISVLTWTKYDSNKPETKPIEAKEYLVCNKRDKVYWEHWDGFNFIVDDAVIYWTEIKV